MPHDPGALGPFALGGFKGKGKNRLPKQRSSQNTGSGSASFEVTALAVGLLALPLTAGVAIVTYLVMGYLGYVS